MTQSEFETLREELRGFRAEVENRFSGLEGRFGGLETGFGNFQTDINKRLVRLEAKIDEKPGAMVIYQAALTMMTGMFAMLVGAVILLKTLGVP